MAPKILSLDDIPPLTQSYKSRASGSTPQTTPLPKNLNDRISVIKYDITRLSLDAIVNAANARLAGGGGVDGAIHAAAGPALKAHCKTLHGCPTGSAKMTEGFNLPCKQIIHAVGPVYKPTDPKHSEKLLRGCYRTSLELAHEDGCASVAFSSISTGVYGYPLRDATEVVVDEIRDWMDSRPESSMHVVFCVFSETDEEAYLTALPARFPPVA